MLIQYICASGIVLSVLSGLNYLMLTRATILNILFPKQETEAQNLSNLPKDIKV